MHHQVLQRLLTKLQDFSAAEYDGLVKIRIPKDSMCCACIDFPGSFLMQQNCTFWNSTYNQQKRKSKLQEPTKLNIYNATTWQINYLVKDILCPVATTQKGIGKHLFTNLRPEKKNFNHIISLFFTKLITNSVGQWPSVLS